MCKIIAIANQKGGVGKTTTAVNLAAALAKKNKRVLAIDLDPQANLTEYVGYQEDNRTTLTELFEAISVSGKVDVEYVRGAIRISAINNFDYIPSNINLANAEVYLLNVLSRQTVLKRILKPELISDYDYVIIDCLPSLGVLLINALVCADGIIIPAQTQKFAIDGLTGLLGVCEQVSDTVNPHLRLIGVLPTMVDRTAVTGRIINILNNNTSVPLMRTRISKAIEAAKSAESGKALCLYKNKLGAEYKQLAEEVIKEEW